MYGVWCSTRPGWCYITDDAQASGLHGGMVRSASKKAAEEALAAFRKEYPGTEYELRMHSSDCTGTWFGQCCAGEDPEEQY